MPSCLFYLFSVSVSWWSPSRGPILIGLKFLERKKCRIFILFRFGRGYIEYNHIREAERWKRSELSRFHGLIEHD